MKMPIPDDVEGHCLAADLPPVIDAHVHVFPAALFEAVRSWFDAYAWPVRYRLDARRWWTFSIGAAWPIWWSCSTPIDRGLPLH
jgi:hypothetical protein